LKKVLLISTNRASTPYPVPPLGLSYLHQRLQSDYEVRVIDGLAASTETVLDCLDDFDPDYVGISIRNIDDMVKGAAHSFIPELITDFIGPIRKRFHGLLILGGSGFTIFPRELMRLSGADYGITGEAEEKLLRLLRGLDNGTDLSELPWLLDSRSQKGPRQTKEYLDLGEPFYADLDRLIDYSPYMERGAYPIQTKRGCIHRCIYCSYPVLEGSCYRKRQATHVVDELEAASKRMGKRATFEFVDSTFNDPPGHAEAICREIVRRGLRVNLRTMGINPANVSDELLDLMRRAGFAQIDSTPDSASPTVLKKMGKNFTLKQLQQSAGLIRKHQMPTMWFFIFGGPGESVTTVDETFEFVDTYIDQDDMVHVTEGLRIYPSTPLYNLALKEKLISKDQSLLDPVFYVSSLLGEKGLTQIIDDKIKSRPNCIRISETKPPPELMAAAMKERKEKKLTEPMFRTLLRLKRNLVL